MIILSLAVTIVQLLTSVISIKVATEATIFNTETQFIDVASPIILIELQPFTTTQKVRL